MKHLSLPALLLAVVLATPACTYLDQASTGPPTITWGGPVSPPASSTVARADTSRIPESEALPDTVSPDSAPHTPVTDAASVPSISESDDAPEDVVFFDIEDPDTDPEMPAEVPERTLDLNEDESADPPSPVDPFDDRPPLEPETTDERIVQVEATDVAVEPEVDTQTPEVSPVGRAVSLAELTRNDRRNLSLPAGLTGINKPDGLSLRFRRYVPPDLPSFVPVLHNELPLFIADETPDGWLAFYKGECGGLGDVCLYQASLFDTSGNQKWSLQLNEFLRQHRYVEIQDVRLYEGMLYFNEACATYSDEVDGQCSYLSRVNPEAAALEWRTPPLTSNNIFIFHGPYVIAGYGFTAEPDNLYIIDQQSGEVVNEANLDSAHEYMEVKNGILHVVTYRSVYTFAFN